MPLVQYFAWVGSVLLALLFIADAYLQKLPVAGNTEVQRPIIRVYSDQNKWPERIVFDTAAVVPKPSADADVITPAAPTVARVSPRVRGALAELQTSDAGPPVNAKKPEARPQRLHKFGTRHTARPVLLLARRSPFGWFGPRIW
jgi:hypothetical protein